MSAEASVHISVSPTNDKPLGTRQSNITVSGPTVLTLRAVDNDEPTAPNSSELRQFARVSTFPRIGQLYQTTDAGERGSLMDSSVQHVPFVADWASEVLRFSSQISRCAGCNVWSGAGGTQCKQGRTGATSTCVGAACAVPFGAPLVWGDGSCADDAWHATHLLGPSEYFPTYGDSPLSWQPSGEANGREFFELAFPSEMYISAVEIFEVFNPGAVYRVSAARAYEDDNTIACCGDDFPSGGQCDGLPRCSSDTSWTTLWSGAAAPAAEESRAFSPPLCPARFKSRVLRVEMDAAAVASWNNIDAVRLSGTTQLPAGDVIPSAGVSRVTYVPVEGTHGADGFEFEVSDCVAYGPPTAVELWVPPPAEAFVAPPYLVVEAIRDANASSTAAYADLAAPSAAGGASLYETLTALRDEAAAEGGEAEGGIVVELRGVERLGGVWVGGQRLAARGDSARLDAATWQPSLRLEVTGLGRAELWFSAAASSVTFRVVLAVAAAVPQVRLGILLPMFSAGLVVTQVLWSPLVGVHQAIAEINNKSDGVADDLLPDTRLDFAYADSRCDLAHALQGALQLISSAGVAAIIGAGCSGGSTTAALVGEGSRVPIISPTSTSPQLSDGRGYPYFLRTVPSDAFSAIAMGDLLQALFNYTSVAMIHSTDAYGAGLAQAFGEVAPDYGLTIGLTQSFAQRAPDFTSQLRALRQSGLRVGVIFCVADDGGRFLTQGYQQGVGGEGFFWLGGDTFADAQLWEGAELIAKDEALRSRVLRGFFSVFPNGQPQNSERYQRYVARRQSLRPFGGDGVGCSQETDSQGTLLWAQDHDGNRSTPNACFEYDVRVDGFYDPFGYDAVFALAHALHDLVEVRGKTEIVGSELVDTLLRRVRFDGVTGLVEFYDASDDPSRLYRGDRRLGFAYHLLNFVSSEQALVLVGTWRPCSNGTCSFSERWSSTAAPLIYSTADNRQPAQSVAVSCPYGEALTPDGRCVCDNGFEPDPTGEQCRRCNAGQDSRRPSNASGAPACDLCAAGYYRQHAHSPVSECQSCAAFPNVRCALNATLESVELSEGYWRLSGLSSEVLQCAGQPAASPCAGGSRAGERGVGYCRAGRHGPRCELCANSSQYISRGECVDCPEAHGRILLLAAPLAALAALAALVLCVAPRFAPRAYRFAQQRKIRLEAGISNLALIPKLKLAVSFFQTVGFLPAVYGLGLPDYYYNWIDFVHIFDLDWMAVLFPTACLAGGFHDRLLIRALTPIVLVVCVLMFGAIYHLLHRRESGHRLRKNVLKLLPIVLFLAFIFTPTTSFSIFSVWTCETFHVDSLREVPVTVQFLRGDLSIECDRAVPEYRRLMDVAFLFVAIWPVGVPLLFLLVLYSGSWAIQHGQSTQIEAATGFLHREYSKAYYWWEVLFLLQRLLVVGFAQWISHPTHRFLFALSVALVYLVALLAVKPYKRADVGLMAYSSQFATVLIFFVSMFIHLFGMLEAVDEAIEFDGLTSLVLAFSSLDSLVVTSIAIILAFFAAFMALTLYQMAVSNNIQLFRLTSSTQIPELSLDTNKLFHLFLSHIWSSGQDQVANIKRKLQLMLPGCQIFLDVDDLENIGDLEHYVEASQSVLIFLSKGYFFSANCLRELESALCALIPLILVHEKDVSKGGAPLDTLRAESEHPLFNDNREIIEWHRAGEFQLLALKRIAQSLLHATPLFRKLRQFPKLYLPGELSSQSLHFPGMITVYASPHNPGCRKAAEEIRFRYKDKNLLIEYVQPVELQTSKPRQSTAAAIDIIARARRSSLGTPFRKNRRSEPRDSSLGGRFNKFRLLLYLNQKTFVGPPGNELADEVRTARKRGVEIILMHENDEARGGCPFSRNVSPLRALVKPAATRESEDCSSPLCSGSVNGSSSCSTSRAIESIVNVNAQHLRSRRQINIELCQQAHWDE
ncbi:hypothetical protein AB1Y20_012416 [Prymnesium parvum]|uniref:Receptor ligand binding region domain-containing protein n=1 Tax=Prymnesium parvum TaxID=97485 RepID=A0AB34IHV3_PRYPA